MSTLVMHGSYYAVSPYKVTQHEYASSDCEDRDQGYIELLEVKDPPTGRNRFVVHKFMAYNDDHPRTEHVVVSLSSRWRARRAFERLCTRTDLYRVTWILGHRVEYLPEGKFPWVYEPGRHRGVSRP